MDTNRMVIAGHVRIVGILVVLHVIRVLAALKRLTGTLSGVRRASIRAMIQIMVLGLDVVLATGMLAA